MGELMAEYLWLSGTHSSSPTPYKSSKTSYKTTTYVKKEPI